MRNLRYHTPIVCPDSPFLLRTSGFTLLEIIVSIALLGLLTAIFGMGLVAAVQSHEFSRTNADLIQKSELAMTRIQRELMELTRVVGITDDQTTYGINRFIIYERMVPQNNRDAVRFALHFHPADKALYLYTDLDDNLSQLDGSTIDQADRLIDGVDHVAFECYKGDDPWDETTDAQSLLSTIRITVDLVRRDDPDTSHRIRTMVHIRNNNNVGGVSPDSEPKTRNEYSCFIESASRMTLQVPAPDHPTLLETMP
jgi:prepilin-type N-terminal cleavage/methylation domain-containing protein